MRKSDLIKAQIQALRVTAQELLDKDGVTAEELTEIENKIVVENKKLLIQEGIEAAEDAEMEANNGGPLADNIINQGIGGQADQEAAYENSFYNALRGRASIDDKNILDAQNALSSNTGEDGGYLIPVDQRTQIRELKRAFSSLRQYVTVETVTTKTGSRNMEKDAEHTPWADITEGSEIGKTATPKFAEVRYSIKDKGGILPIPNSLLGDNTANLKAYINKWLAKKSVATENAMIITLMETLAKKTITGLDDVKNVFDVDLDPAISAMGVSVMNQDSFNFFNKIKDKNDNYILERDPKNPTKKLLNGRPIIVLSNKILKTKTVNTKKMAPIFMGSLKEAIVLFDREQMSLLSTNIGGDAFAKNLTNVRGIMRLDASKFDTSAAIFGQVDVTPVV